MSVVTIIGAGAMGSALTTPLVENGHDVRLWGTELDGTIVDALKEGKDHPKHKYPLRKETKVFYEQELKQAMEGHDAVIMAITSDALAKIFKRIVPHLSREALVVTVSKGFDYDSEGKVILLPDLLKGILQENDKAGVPIVAVGGPCKANEVLYRSPSCVTYAGENSEAVKKAKGLLQTEVYNVQADGDVIGTEVAAAMKNAYAISLGMAEGFKKREGLSHNNTKSALFTVAIEEMVVLSKAMGGSDKVIFGLPGAGDLEVTGEAGRNRILGEVVGSGVKSSEAIQQMAEQSITVEGYPAVKFGYEKIGQLEKEGRLKRKDFPLLTALYEILYEDKDAYPALQQVLSDYCNRV